MPAEESDDLYDGEYEFVDEDDDAAEAESEEEAAEDKPKKRVKRKTAGDKKPARKKKKASASRTKKEPANESAQEVEETEGETDKEDNNETDDVKKEAGDEYGRTEPETNYVVHVYEVKKFKRTIDYKFTPEDADAFATEYNRTAKNHARWAVPGKEDVKPGKVLAQ